MIGWLLAALALVAYCVVGVVFARTQAIRLQQWINAGKKHRATCHHGCCSHVIPWFARTRSWQNDLRLGLIIYAVSWWVFMPYCGAVWLADHVMAAPIAKRRAEVAAMRAERDSYRAARRDPGDDTSDDILDAAICALDARIEEREV